MSPCSICREHLKEAVSTDCGHFFCRRCLAHHLKSSAQEAVCPICRAPCSEKVLGEGYICLLHEKTVSLFCEESCLLLCVKCLESPEHQSHQELTIEDAISHYKERLNRRSRKLRKDLRKRRRHRAKEEKKLQQLDQLEDAEAVKAGISDLSREIIQLNSLITDLNKMAKQLDANKLKDARVLLDRSVSDTCGLDHELEENTSGSPLQPPSAALTCSPLGYLISDSSPSPLPFFLPTQAPGPC